LPSGTNAPCSARRSARRRVVRLDRPRPRRSAWRTWKRRRPP
jgi:hypothetical protein